MVGRIDVNKIAPTASAGTSNNQAASTAFVTSAIAAAGGGGVTGADGRLTLTSVTPVLTATVSGATTVYYTPYTGQFVPLYDGTSMKMVDVGGELSQATTDATKSPAAVAASSVYDVFVWSDSGTFRATRGPAWTNTTTRSAGTALTRVKGILLNNATITNGPASSRGTYVGTIASNGSSTIDFIFGAAASGGTAAVLNVWNMYNRVSTVTTVTDSGVSYAYASATIRQARASAGNQIQFVLGLQEDGIEFAYSARSQTGSNQFDVNAWGVGFDSTSTFGVQFSQTQTPAAASINGAGTNAGIWSAGIGVHILSANESTGQGTGGYDASSTNALMAKLRM